MVFVYLGANQSATTVSTSVCYKGIHYWLIKTNNPAISIVNLLTITLSQLTHIINATYLFTIKQKNLKHSIRKWTLLRFIDTRGQKCPTGHYKFDGQTQYQRSSASDHSTRCFIKNYLRYFWQVGDTLTLLFDIVLFKKIRMQ